jgi:hypothetical protein
VGCALKWRRCLIPAGLLIWGTAPKAFCNASELPIEQVYLYRDPIDFRKAINALSVLVEQELGLNPFASALYVFTDRGLSIPVHRDR